MADRALPQPVPCGHREGPCTWLRGPGPGPPIPSHVTLGSLWCPFPVSIRARPLGTGLP